MRHLIALGCLLLAGVLAEDLTENAQKTLTALRELKGKEYELLKGLNEDERIDVEDFLEKDAEDHDNAELEAIEAEIKTNNQEITAADVPSSEEETGDAETKVVRVKRSLRARRRLNRQRRNRQLRRHRQGLHRKLRKLRRRQLRKFHGRRRAANRRRHHPRG